MVRVAVDTYGSSDLAINNAGVMDGVFYGDEIDYRKKKPGPGIEWRHWRNSGEGRRLTWRASTFAG